MAFSWQDEDAAREALQDIRNDATDTRWVLFDYADRNTLKLLAKGSGGLDDFRDYLEEDRILYAVLGATVSDQDEGAQFFSALKHIFITWVGPKCKPMEKAKSSQHRLPLYKFVHGFLQLQAELQVLEPSELTEALILEKLRGTRVESQTSAGGASITSAPTSTTVHKTTAPSTSSSTSTSSSSAAPRASAPRSAAPAAAGSSRGFAGTSDVKAEVDFDSEQEAVDAVMDVRNDNSPTNWVVFGHEEQRKNTFKVFGTGSDGLDGMLPFFVDDQIVYGILGQVVEDDSEGQSYKTTKYIFIAWVGPNVKPLTKARSSQNRVALYKWAKSYLQLAAELQVLSKEEISEKAVLDKLCATF